MCKVCFQILILIFIFTIFTILNSLSNLINLTTFNILTTFNKTFILGIVSGVEIAKTDRYLFFKIFFFDTCWNNDFFSYNGSIWYRRYLDLLFKNNVNNYCKRVIATILSLFFVVPKNSFVILIFFISLVLMDGLLPTIYINKERVSKFILPKVFILFFCWFISLEIFGINLLGTWGWLYQHLCFFIGFSQLLHFRSLVLSFEYPTRHG